MNHLELNTEQQSHVKNFVFVNANSPLATDYSVTDVTKSSDKVNKGFIRNEDNSVSSLVSKLSKLVEKEFFDKFQPFVVSCDYSNVDNHLFVIIQFDDGKHYCLKISKTELY